MVDIRLFQFYIEGLDERLYVWSSKDDEDHLRNIFRSNDHGGLDSDIYDDLTENGKIREIFLLSEIPEEDMKWVPYRCSSLEIGLERLCDL